MKPGVDTVSTLLWLEKEKSTKLPLVCCFSWCIVIVFDFLWLSSIRFVSLSTTAAAFPALANFIEVAALEKRGIIVEEVSLLGWNLGRLLTSPRL